MDDPDYVDSSITHFVVTYNFTERFGLSLNLPFAHHSFKRSEVRLGDSGATFQVEQGKESGLADIELRWWRARQFFRRER